MRGRILRHGGHDVLRRNLDLLALDLADEPVRQTPLDLRRHLAGADGREHAPGLRRHEAAVVVGDVRLKLPHQLLRKPCRRAGLGARPTQVLALTVALLPAARDDRRDQFLRDIPAVLLEDRGLLLGKDAFGHLAPQVDLVLRLELLLARTRRGRERLRLLGDRGLSGGLECGRKTGAQRLEVAVAQAQDEGVVQSESAADGRRLREESAVKRLLEEIAAIAFGRPTGRAGVGIVQHGLRERVGIRSSADHLGRKACG